MKMTGIVLLLLLASPSLAQSETRNQCQSWSEQHQRLTTYAAPGAPWLKWIAGATASARLKAICAGPAVCSVFALGLPRINFLCPAGSGTLRVMTSLCS